MLLGKLQTCPKDDMV
jgi:hypothetical protein